MLETLLATGQVDGVIAVGPDQTSPTRFSFRVCRTAADVRACSGSCYQPVEISGALRYALATGGRYAVIALPCMARALRLAARKNSRLSEHMRFVLGLTCGQLKSRHFVDYLAARFADGKMPDAVQFRVKRPDRGACDYAFRFTYDAGDDRLLDRQQVSRRWDDRWFTLEACDYCDDVFAECADATFMDAWLPEYHRDWQGHSLVIVRDTTLQDLINTAARQGRIAISSIPPERVTASQSGVIAQKRILAGCNRDAARHVVIPFVRSGRASVEQRLAAWRLRKIRGITSTGFGDMLRMERRVARVERWHHRLLRGLSLCRRCSSYLTRMAGALRWKRAAIEGASQ